MTEKLRLPKCNITTLTLGELREATKDLPDGTPVFFSEPGWKDIQSCIEVKEHDVMFDKFGFWEVVNINDDNKPVIRAITIMG